MKQLIVGLKKKDIELILTKKRRILLFLAFTPYFQDTILIYDRTSKKIFMRIFPKIMHYGRPNMIWELYHSLIWIDYKQYKKQFQHNANLFALEFDDFERIVPMEEICETTSTFLNKHKYHHGLH